MPKIAKGRDFGQLLEAHGFGERVRAEYRHPGTAEALAGNDTEMRISGLLVQDADRVLYMDGEAVAPGEVHAWLADHPGDIMVSVNSPGGSYFAGVEIMNLLRGHAGNVDMTINGLAASAASLVAMAGDKITMLPASLMMIHRAWSIVLGNAEECRAVANRLELIDGEAAKTYANRSGGDPDDMLALMDAETWFTGESALEAGLIDSLGDPEPDPDDMNAAPEGPAKPDTTDTALADQVQKRSFALLAARLNALTGD